MNLSERVASELALDESERDLASGIASLAHRAAGGEASAEISAHLRDLTAALHSLRAARAT